MKAKGFKTIMYWGYRTLDEQVEILTDGRTFAQFKTKLDSEVGKGNITADQAQAYKDKYDPEKEGHETMLTDHSSPVTWTLDSMHRKGKAADIVPPTGSEGVTKPDEYDTALKETAEAEGLQIGPPASDKRHVQM